MLKSFTLGIILLTGLAHGREGGVGNGGDAMVCFKDQASAEQARSLIQKRIDPFGGEMSAIKSVRLLDFWEYDVDVEQASEDFEDLLEGIFDMLRENAPPYYEALNSARKQLRFQSYRSLPQLRDEGLMPNRPRNCLVIQLAIQKSNGVVLYDQRLFDRLSAQDKAGLRLHEHIYNLAIQKGHFNSHHVRAVNSVLFSNPSPFEIFSTFDRHHLSVVFQQTFLEEATILYSTEIKKSNWTFEHVGMSSAHFTQDTSFGSIMDVFKEDSVEIISRDTKWSMGFTTVVFPGWRVRNFPAVIDGEFLAGKIINVTIDTDRALRANGKEILVAKNSIVSFVYENDKFKLAGINFKNISFELEGMIISSVAFDDQNNIKSAVLSEDYAFNKTTILPKEARVAISEDGVLEYSSSVILGNDFRMARPNSHLEVECMEAKFLHGELDACKVRIEAANGHGFQYKNFKLMSGKIYEILNLSFENNSLNGISWERNPSLLLKQKGRRLNTNRQVRRATCHSKSIAVKNDQLVCGV